jgi:hypothetical protein
MRTAYAHRRHLWPAWRLLVACEAVSPKQGNAAQRAGEGGTAAAPPLRLGGMLTRIATVLPSEPRLQEPRGRSPRPVSRFAGIPAHLDNPQETASQALTNLTEFAGAAA